MSFGSLLPFFFSLFSARLVSFWELTHTLSFFDLLFLHVYEYMSRKNLVRVSSVNNLNSAQLNGHFVSV